MNLINKLRMKLARLISPKQKLGPAQLEATMGLVLLKDANFAYERRKHRWNYEDKVFFKAETIAIGLEQLWARQRKRGVLI